MQTLFIRSLVLYFQCKQSSVDCITSGTRRAVNTTRSDPKEESVKKLLFIALAGILAGVILAMVFPSSTKAQQFGCDSFNGAIGARQRYICYVFGNQAENCYPDICEEDICNVSCPTGYAYFCVGFPYCGLPALTGCEGQSCG